MSASTKEYKCKYCRGPFTARTADRKRGWARFCGKSCAASYKSVGRRRNGFVGRDLDDDYYSLMDIMDEVESPHGQD